MTVDSPPRMYRPIHTLMLALTDDCNLRCTYCFVDKKPRHMSSEAARKAIDFYLSPDVSGAEYRLFVNFFGGEPFMALDRMEEVIEYARKPRSNTGKTFLFGATTNGTIFNRRVEDLVRGAGMAILFSLDGGPEVTASDRPYLSGRSSYRAAAANLERFAEVASDLIVRATFHTDSLDLVSRVESLFELGAPAIGLCPILEGNWSARVDAINEAYDRLADWYLRHIRPDRVPQLETTHELLRLWHRHQLGGPRPVVPCPVAHSLLGIDPDGNVMPCHRFLYRRHDWLTTVDHPERLGDRRGPYLALHSGRIPECASCEAAPVCSGGCRVVALNAGLGLQDAYPNYCITTRAHFRAVIRIHEGLKERGWLPLALTPRPRLDRGLLELISTG